MYSPASLLLCGGGVVFNKREDATERLIEYAENVKDTGQKEKKLQDWRTKSVDERLSYALVKGITEYIEEDTEEQNTKKIKEIIQEPIIFKNRQALGDILMFTAAVRDFHKEFPDWPIGVSSTAMHIWDNNPHIDRSLTEQNAKIVEIGPSWLTNASNRDDRHFANAFRISIEQKLGISFDQGLTKPDIWMSREEVEAPPLVEPPYWIIVAGRSFCI